MLQWYILGILIIIINLISIYSKNYFKLSLFTIGGYQNYRKLINAYHYEFKLSKHLIQLVVILISVIGIAIYLKLNYFRLTLLIILALIVSSKVIIALAMNQYYAKEFESLTTFLQYFIAFYKSDSHLLKVINECIKVSDNNIKEKLSLIANKLVVGNNPSEAYSLLRAINSHFIVYNPFHYIASIEVHGAHTYLSALDQMSEDIEIWIRDTYLLNVRKIKTNQRTLILIILSLSIALLATISLMDLGFNYQSSLYQNALFLYLVSVLITLLMSYKIFETSWIDKEECVCINY